MLRILVQPMAPLRTHTLRLRRLLLLLDRHAATDVAVVGALLQGGGAGDELAAAVAGDQLAGVEHYVCISTECDGIAKTLNEVELFLRATVVHLRLWVRNLKVRLPLIRYWEQMLLPVR